MSRVDTRGAQTSYDTRAGDNVRQYTPPNVRVQRGGNSERDRFLDHASLDVHQNNPQASPWFTPKGAYILFQRKFQPGSIKGSIFTLVVAIVGAGTLSFPKAFQAVGIIPAVVILTLAAFVAYASLCALVVCSKYLPDNASTSYRSLAQESIGNCGAIFAQICLMLNLFGTTVSYIVAAGEIAHICLRAIAESLHVDHFIVDNKLWIMIILTAAIIFPLSLCRDMSSLRFTSLLGVTCSAYLAIMITVKYFQYCLAGTHCSWDNPRACTSCFWTPAWDARELLHGDPGGYVGLMTAFPLVIYGYTCHPNVLPLYLELQRRSPRRMNKVTRRSLGVAYTIYLFAGWFGMMTFAGLSQKCGTDANPLNIEGVCGNILRNDYENNVSMIIAAAMIAISATLTIPLFAHAFRYNLGKMIYRGADQEWHNADPSPPLSLLEPLQPQQADIADPAELPLCLHVTITLCMLGFALLVALLVNDIADVFGILGSTTNPIICYILPTIFFVKLVPSGEAFYKKVGLTLMAVTITGLSICSFIRQIQSIVGRSKNHSHNGWTDGWGI